ncbi:MAG: hypothetical protein HRT37_19155 [Alteromonadaceae bacterium]|nr:hypothetical protein [Alteromonadaceae bacterium]
MIIEQFINDKITQITSYITAVINHQIHYTELDQFIIDTMEEWTLLTVYDDMPSNARERVFWHIMHEFSLHSAQNLEQDLFFKSEISTCIDFFSGTGSYPIDCIGYRPIA